MVFWRDEGLRDETAPARAKRDVIDPALAYRLTIKTAANGVQSIKVVPFCLGAVSDCRSNHFERDHQRVEQQCQTTIDYPRAATSPGDRPLDGSGGSSWLVPG